MAVRLNSLDDPRLSELLKKGSIGILPTDTVYGLVGSARSKQAITRLYSLKSRQRQPGTTIAASTDQLASIGFPIAALQHAKPFWPNALSVEMSASQIPDYLKVGQPVMAARIPSHPELLALLTQTGPLMTTSANTPGAPTSRTINEAAAYFGDEVDFYVDAGDLGERPPSTIIGFSEAGEVIVYRQGAVEVESLGLRPSSDQA